MKTIHKYPLNITDIQVVHLPEGARVLAAAEQGMGLYIWVLVDPDVKSEPRVFAIIGTGHSVPDEFEAQDHVGTVMMGAFVWHIFETARPVKVPV